MTSVVGAYHRDGYLTGRRAGSCISIVYNAYSIVRPYSTMGGYIHSRSCILSYAMLQYIEYEHVVCLYSSYCIYILCCIIE